MSWQLGFISVHPKMIEAYRGIGVFKAAEATSKAMFTIVDLRDFAADKHATIDGAPYGGGDGMVMRPDCLGQAVDSLFTTWNQKARVVYTSPSGRLWSQADAQRFAETQEPTVFVCGRFGGVDQRFLDRYVTEHFSVGDFVLAGGELPALMMAESALRFVPGVLGNDASAAEDSFGVSLEGMLEYPSYTRPSSWEGQDVPAVLLSGNHQEILKWRKAQSLERTKRLRPDLLKK